MPVTTASASSRDSPALVWSRSRSRLGSGSDASGFPCAIQLRECLISGVVRAIRAATTDSNSWGLDMGPSPAGPACGVGWEPAYYRLVRGASRTEMRQRGAQTRHGLDLLWRDRVAVERQVPQR